MNEGRIVLCIFGVAAFLMIAVPVGMLLMARQTVPTDAAMQGEVSRFFLAAETHRAPGQLRQTLPEIIRILPPGTPDDAVFAKFAASGFTCAPDAASASCFRTVTEGTCRSDWRVSVVFDAAEKIKTSEADSRTSCS